MVVSCFGIVTVLYHFQLPHIWGIKNTRLSGDYNSIALY